MTNLRSILSKSQISLIAFLILTVSVFDSNSASLTGVSIVGSFLDGCGLFGLTSFFFSTFFSAFFSSFFSSFLVSALYHCFSAATLINFSIVLFVRYQETGKLFSL
jgi:hypothetical protein